MSTTLYRIIQSELIKQGFDEFIDEQGELVYFDDEHQFMTKIIQYDDDVEKITQNLFTGMKLKNKENDQHFKRSFVLRFLNRNINRQTVESFQAVLTSTFLVNEQHLNLIYEDLENFIKQSQSNENENIQDNQQQSSGTTLTDNRQAFSELPQNNVQLDVDSTIMERANDNTISRNKQSNQQTNSGITKGTSKTSGYQYSMENLERASHLLENVLKKFDQACFMQVW